MAIDSSTSATPDRDFEATPLQSTSTLGSAAEDVAGFLQHYGVDLDPAALGRAVDTLGWDDIEKHAPGIVGSTTGLTPEQTKAAAALYKQMAAANGTMDLSKLSQSSTQLGQLGLVDPQTAKKLSSGLDSLGRRDIVSAAANAAGVDPNAAKLLLSDSSTLADRGSAALDLYGVDVPPETLDKAVSDLGEGNFNSSIDALSGAGGEVGKGADFARDVYDATQDSSTTANEWTNVAAEGADLVGLDDEYQTAIRAAPEVYDDFSALLDGDESTDATFDATSDLTRAVLPGAEGEVAASALDLIAGKSIDEENFTEAALSTLGVSEDVSKAGGDVANVVANGANTSSLIAASGSALEAAGAPKEVGAVATAASGIAAGGITGYGAVAMGVGELIGGKTGETIGKIGAYAAAAAGGPVGWAAGAAMLAMDLFGYEPPRKAQISTQNGAFMGQGQDGAPALFSATQNGGEDEMKIKVQQLNTEIEQKPEAMRASNPDRGGQIAEGEVLLNGEWMYGNGRQDSDVRAGIDPELGFVVQKKGDNDEWQTTWRADVNPPPGSFVQMNPETGKLEVYAPAETVVPGKSPEDARSNAEFVKIWESNNGEAAPEGRENILYLAKSGGFGQGQRNQPDNGEDVDWDVAKFTEQNDSGVFGTGLGGSHSEADGGHMVSQEGTTDYETSGEYGYFDNADQLMQQIDRGGLIDLAFKSEEGDDYVLYNKGNNQFDELTKEDYEARVAEESKVA